MNQNKAEFIQARQEKTLADSVRLEKHKEIYVKIQSKGSDDLINFAQQRISLWKSNQTCSPYYIETWERVLNDFSLFEHLILNPQNHHLRQNTPFMMKGI